MMLFLHGFTINISEGCSIQARAYGGNNFAEVKYGYLKLNRVPVWQSSWVGEHANARGANVFVIDRSTCTLLESKNYDTFGDATAAARLRGYIEGLSDASVLVGISIDDSSYYMDAAEATLSALGADVSDVEFRGAWAFVTETGDPSKTVFDKELTEASAMARQPFVAATVSGTQCNILQRQVSRDQICG